MGIGKPKAVADYQDTQTETHKPAPKNPEPKSMGITELFDDLEANIKANVGKDGLTPQAKRALQKLATARQLLGSKQGKPDKE